MGRVGQPSTLKSGVEASGGVEAPTTSTTTSYNMEVVVVEGLVVARRGGGGADSLPGLPAGRGSHALDCQCRVRIPCPACACLVCLPCAAGDRCQPVGMMEGPQAPPGSQKYFTFLGCRTAGYSRTEFFTLTDFTRKPIQTGRIVHVFHALSLFPACGQCFEYVCKNCNQTCLNSLESHEKRLFEYGNHNCNRVETAGCLETNRRIPALGAAIRCARPADRCRGAARGALPCPVHGCRDLGLSRGVGRRAIKVAAHG